VETIHHNSVCNICLKRYFENIQQNIIVTVFKIKKESSTLVIWGFIRISPKYLVFI